MYTYVKYLGLLVIIPILMILLIPDYTDKLDSEIASDVGVNQSDIDIGDNTIMNSTSQVSEETSKEVDEKICFTILGEVPCDELDSKMIQKETFEVKEKSIDENIPQYSSIVRSIRENVPATIPLHQGYYNGEAVYYIITDSSDSTYAEIISKNQDWKVELALLLVNASKSVLSTTYMFTNGVPGDGVHGFQGEIFTSTPAQADIYSALTSNIQVTWKETAIPIILDSEKELMIAKAQRLITFTEIDVVLNMPQLVWPEGQMPVKADKTVTDDTPFGGGQVLDIDLEEKTVTFIAHRGWGPDGRIIYFIVTDATPLGPANSMGVTNAPVTAKLIESPTAADLFHFMNGLNGTGPFGFQSGISSSAPGDSNYTPMWRIFMIAWDDPQSASLITVKKNIDFYEQQGLISVNLARPMNADHIVNSPIIDPFQ